MLAPLTSGFRQTPVLGCWLIFVDLTQAWVFWEEEASVDKMVPSNWPIGQPVGYLYKLLWEGLIHCGWCHPWAGDPELQWNVAEQARKQHALLLTFRFLLKLLSTLAFLRDRLP